MTTRSTSYMRESFVEDLLRKSVPQSKVAARLRLNVLCWCTLEARKYSITSAIVMAAVMTSCSSAILVIKEFTKAFTRNRFMSKWWHWSKVEAWNFTIKTFKICQFNGNRPFVCRLKSEHNCSGESARNMKILWMMLWKQGALKIFKCWNSVVVFAWPNKISGYAPGCTASIFDLCGDY